MKCNEGNLKLTKPEIGAVFETPLCAGCYRSVLTVDQAAQLLQVSKASIYDSNSRDPPHGHRTPPLAKTSGSSAITSFNVSSTKGFIAMADDVPRDESELVDKLVRIFRRGLTWSANYQFGGRQYRKSLKSTSKKEARRLALLLEDELLEGRSPVLTRPPTAEHVVEQYLDSHRTDRLTAKTLANYKRVLERRYLLLTERDAISILNLNTRTLNTYLSRRVKEGVGEQTLYTEKVIVRQLVDFVMSRDLITRAPLRGLKISEPKSRVQPYWSPNQVERILAASLEPRRSMFTVSADVGMSISKLSHLTWNVIAVRKNVLHIRPKEDWRTKAGHQRVVPMSQRVQVLLKNLPHGYKWVFTAPASPRYALRDNQVSERRLLVLLRQLLRGLGLKRHMHTVQHTCNTKALVSDIDAHIFRDCVVHVDRDILRLYAHIASIESQIAMRQVTNRRVEERQKAMTNAIEETSADPAHFQHTIMEPKMTETEPTAKYGFTSRFCRPNGEGRISSRHSTHVVAGPDTSPEDFEGSQLRKRAIDTVDSGCLGSLRLYFSTLSPQSLLRCRRCPIVLPTTTGPAELSMYPLTTEGSIR